MKMDSWTFCVIFSLCFWSHLQMLLAKKEFVTVKQKGDWIDDTGSSLVKDEWLYSKGRKALTTVVKPGGESWFMTPLLQNLPATSYLVLEASCSNNSCQLEIYGTNQSPGSIRSSEFINNVTFPNRSRNITTIKKKYSHLFILARVMDSSAETVFDIHFIEIHYYFCDETLVYNTKLSKVPSSTTNISKPVPCPHNTVSTDGNTEIIINCTPKGNWIHAECVCKKGFYSKNMGCLQCPDDYFKYTIGDEECKKCPKSKTHNETFTGCECKKDHYVGNDENGPCFVVPSEVENMNISTLPKSAINITWTKPKDGGGFNGSITYTVEVYRCSNQSTCNVTANEIKYSPGKTKLTTTYVVVSNLVFKQNYKIKVISMNSLKNVPTDKWKFAEEKFTVGARAAGESENKKSNNIFIYVGAAVGFVVLLLFIILIIITRYRRGRLGKDGKDNHGFDKFPLNQRIYVDPSIYDDPEAALRDFANEISKNNLKLERVIGGGEFGDVYKGILKTEAKANIEVAIKTLKHDSDARSRKDFFLEGSAMGQFDDPNVIHLEGVVTRSIPHMIVIEYMANGSLDNFLKKHDGQFTELQLVGMARGVASGMKYLAAMNFVHRDLAARNILVNEGMLCKVADFGLSRELENADSSRGEYCATGGKIPVRWTAPEAIKYRKFSTASDVWSYGILLWEIMSFAERPYWDWDNFKLLERVDEGYRLPAPKNCPKAVHELMLLCWEIHRENRPEFTAIVKMLDDWIRSPETIRYENLTKRPVSAVSVNDPAMVIQEWLNDIKMSSYIPHFTQAGFAKLSDLAGLQDSDLQSIGVSLIGHRNKMLRTIRSLPITEESKKTSKRASLNV